MHKPYIAEVSVPRPEWLGSGVWRLAGLTPITTIFGKNGSGKSLLLRNWRDTDAESCHYVVPERSGELDYQANFLLQQLDAQQRRQNTARNFVEQYRRQIVARIQGYFATRGNVRQQQLPGDPADLEAAVTQLLPDFTIALSGTGNPPYKIVRAADGAPIGGIDALSSGEAQLITIALDVLTIAAIWDIENRPQRIMLIDEPDAHIHPDLQVRFADFIVNTATKFKLQVVIASHSTTLLAALGQFGAEHASVLYLDRVKTVIKAQPFNSVMKEMAACLGGHALMGPLFSVPLLLVEGDDDYRIWSQVPRHHVVSFAVIPCHGEEIHQYRKSLERLFATLREPTETPAGYALLDGDKPKPTPTPDNSQDHVRYLGLACRESENLYLTDEVLQLFDITWEEAKVKVVAEAPKFGRKADLLRTIGSWDRLSTDLKDVIHQLAEILDPKKVHWTVRVAASIGRNRPSGQVADFLGNDVVTALWGDAPIESAFHQ